jgi:hypothetical protein
MRWSDKFLWVVAVVFAVVVVLQIARKIELIKCF